MQGPRTRQPDRYWTLDSGSQAGARAGAACRSARRGYTYKHVRVFFFTSRVSVRPLKKGPEMSKMHKKHFTEIMICVKKTRAVPGPAGPRHSRKPAGKGLLLCAFTSGSPAGRPLTEQIVEKMPPCMVTFTKNPPAPVLSLCKKRAILTFIHI